MLKQISVGYDPLEDRMHLQLRCQEGEQEVDHRLLLTRRLCLPFHGGLVDLVRRTAQVPETVPEPTRRALEAGHHQARLQQTPMHRERRQPTPDTDPAPRLVVRAACGHRRKDQRPVLRFEFKAGEPLAITLSERTLHALAASLEDRMRRAEWLTAEAGQALARQPVGSTPPAGLH